MGTFLAEKPGKLERAAVKKTAFAHLGSGIEEKSRAEKRESRKREPGKNWGEEKPQGGVCFEKTRFLSGKLEVEGDPKEKSMCGRGGVFKKGKKKNTSSQNIKR